MRREIKKSFKEYITTLGHWGWVVLVDICLGAWGAYNNIVGNGAFPTWGWVILLVIGLVVVPFIVFHKKRVKFDELCSRFVTAEQIKNILTNLGNLRSKGVDLRNEGMGLQSEEKVGEWTKTVDSWTESVLSEIEKLSPSEASIFRTLDWVEFPPFERVLNAQHHKYLREHSQRLISLKNLVLRYSPENLIRKSSYENR